MNGKKAKMLRMFARIESVGLPDVIYEDVVQNPKKPHSVTKKLGKCTRGFYQLLKNEYKLGRL